MKQELLTGSSVVLSCSPSQCDSVSIHGCEFVDCTGTASCNLLFVNSSSLVFEDNIINLSLSGNNQVGLRLSVVQQPRPEAEADG